MDSFYKFMMVLACLFTLYLMFIELVNCCSRSLQAPRARPTGGGNNLQRPGELGTATAGGNATGGEASAVGNSQPDNGINGIAVVERGIGGGNHHNENEGDGGAAAVVITPGYVGGTGGHDVNGGFGVGETSSAGAIITTRSEGSTGHGTQVNVDSAVVLAGQMDVKRPDK